MGTPDCRIVIIRDAAPWHRPARRGMELLQLPGYSPDLNPIESTFATVRFRTVKTKGSSSRIACLTMVFKLMESASKSRRCLNGSALLPVVNLEVKFVDGIEVKDAV